MIHRIGKGFTEGDIIEFNERSEPLYLYYQGELIQLTPQEYNAIANKEKTSRGMELYAFRGKYLYEMCKGVFE